MAMIYDGWLNIKDWMRERAAVYEKYAKRMPSMDDHIGISMRLENYGFLYTALYKNGRKVIEMPLSEIAYPLISIVKWLERIIDLPTADDKFEESLHLDCEGCHVMMHYELVHAPEFATVQDYKGLVIVYGTWANDPKWKESTLAAIVSLPEFVSSIYNGILNFFAPLPNRKYTEDHIVEMWPAEDGAADDVMQLYNEVKSPKLEWFIAPKEYAKWFDVDFKQVRIQKTLLMEARQDGLFWDEDNECVGNQEMLHIDGVNIDLTSLLPDLRKWLEKIPEPTSKKYEGWGTRGYLLAQKVRALMPEHVDLFFVNDLVKYKQGHARYKIVPDMRQVIKGEHNGMRYRNIK